MQPRQLLLLVLSSLFNGAICFVSFWFMVFATGPEMQDVTMRFGYYVANGIIVVALFGIVGPWIFAHKAHHKRALLVATLPTVLVCTVILAFLLLDSWLQRNFSS